MLVPNATTVDRSANSSSQQCICPEAPRHTTSVPLWYQVLTQASGNTFAQGGSCGHYSPWLHCNFLCAFVQSSASLSSNICVVLIGNNRLQRKAASCTDEMTQVSPFSQRTENPSITQLISRVSAPAYCLPVPGGPPATVPQHSNHGLQQPSLHHTHSPPPPHNATRRSRRTYPTSSRSDQDRRAADMPTRRCHHSRARVARLKNELNCNPPTPHPSLEARGVRIL